MGLQARKVMDFILPPLCAICRAPVTGHHAVCGACWGQLDFLAAPWCECCGVPFGVNDQTAQRCAVCATEPPAYGTTRAVLGYNESARALVSRFKYGDQLHLMPLLAPWLLKAGREVLAGADVIVPVPLHWRRLLWRRYNQAALLAQGIGRASGVAVDLAGLSRIKYTAPQVGQQRKARLANVQKAFKASPRVNGKVVVLVDDVLTTGATLTACAEALRKAGAKDVRTLTLARVILPAQMEFS